jgi:hypothetical protein
LKKSVTYIADGCSEVFLFLSQSKPAIVCSNKSFSETGRSKFKDFNLKQFEIKANSLK